MDVYEIIGIIVGIMGVVFGVIAYMRNKRTDDEKDGKKDGMVLTELGYIKSGVDDIKRKQERQEQQHIEVVKKLTAVEASAKQAHRRIDMIERNLNP